MSRALSRLLPVDDLVVPAVAETVRALEPEPEDAALVRLAQRYAAAIDGAAQLAAELTEVAAESPEDAKSLALLAKRVEAQTVLAEIGPKLMAALVELGASPKARASLSKGGAPSDSSSGPSKLQQLRARRVRPDGAEVVDAAAP